MRYTAVRILSHFDGERDNPYLEMRHFDDISKAEEWARDGDAIDWLVVEGMPATGIVGATAIAEEETNGE